MRIERVVARAFGPLRNEVLTLALGMTVVAGPNEAGKSSWHAALRMAVTGLRRGKGPGTAAERQLVERHRPWDGAEGWAVEARLRLADGRLIDISQDLAGKVDCRAMDVGLGRDVSHEILDGTPDASRWLGLSRDAFGATVSVSQAQILAVTDAADELQEHMQRAAATHGADATAAEAIERLEQFRRDAVGVDRVGARGPLRSTKERLATLEAHLAEARRQHAEYLERSAEVEVAERRVAAARRAALDAEAALVALRAAGARRRHREAAELAARHPVAPEAVAARDGRADEVAGAIEAWESRPTLVELAGATAADLERALADLPLSAEPGDVEPHPTVRDAQRALDLAEDALAQLAEEPPGAEVADLPALDEAAIRGLARRLRTSQLPGAAQLQDELDAARAALAESSRSARTPLFAVTLAALVAGVALLVVGQPAMAVVLLLAAGAAGAGSWLATGPARVAAERVDRAEAALRPYREAQAAAEADRAAAEAEARAANLPADPTTLDELADRVASTAAARRAGFDREARRERLAERRRAAAERLAQAITNRGGDGSGDPRAAWSGYEAACRHRAARAAAFERRAGLERAVEARRAAERSAAAARAATDAALQRLRDAATALGFDPAPRPEGIVAQLRAWQAQRGEAARRSEAAGAEWQRLQALLDGATLEDLDARAAERERELAALSGRLGSPPAVPDASLQQLEALVSQRKDALLAESGLTDALRGNLEARREALPDVAEAEESVAAARAELDRVVRLADTLDRAIALLRSAEERVHRSLAPVLASAIARWLPAVCGGSYVDVSVDPANLSVRVKEAATGSWREARLLSEGTREQIYLLLRVAMAEHLVTNGEVAPLILDEVTVQSDGERKRQLLDVLHRLSAERQVVLFTHDDDVLAWADRVLVAERDTTILLPPRTREAHTGATPIALPVGDESPAVPAD